MFEFTTQTIYNSITVSPDGNGDVVKGANVLVGTDPKKPQIRIGNTRFNVDDIHEINVKNPSDKHLAEVEFDLSEVVIENNNEIEETTGRIALYLGLSMASQDSLYANALLYKGKPLFIEFPIKKGDTADALAKTVKKIADRYQVLMFQENILDIEVTSSAEVPGQGGADPTPAVGKVKFIGINGYQQIKKAILQVYNPSAYTLDCCSTQGGFIDKVIGVPVMYTISSGTLSAYKVSNKEQVFEGYDDEGEIQTRDLANNEVPILPGIEAFCDYNWIIRNLRLPTLANTHFWAPTKGDMPAVGGKYTQFTIEMRVDNVGIAGEAVGQRHTSTTKHVLYVSGEYNSSGDSPAKTLYTKLNSLASSKIKTDTETKLNDPYHTT